MEARTRGRIGYLPLIAFLAVGAIVVIGAGVGFMAWSTSHHDDASALTVSIQAKVTDAKAPNQTNMVWSRQITYTYEYQGHTYRDTDYALTKVWDAGQPLFVCIDPANPVRQIPRDRTTTKCGSKDMGRDALTATRIN